VDALHLPCLGLHGLAGPLLSTFWGNGRDKHLIVFKTAYFNVLTYAISHSVIYRVLESDVGSIFVQDTQRLENGNVRIPDVVIHSSRKGLENKLEIVLLRYR
jgi:hypothetical protein